MLALFTTDCPEYLDLLPREGAGAPRSLLRECWAPHMHRNGEMAMAKKRQK